MHTLITLGHARHTRPFREFLRGAGIPCRESDEPSSGLNFVMAGSGFRNLPAWIRSRRRPGERLCVLNGCGSAALKTETVAAGAALYECVPFSIPKFAAEALSLLLVPATPPCGLTIDADAVRVEIGGRGYELPARQFAVFEAMARYPGRVYSRKQLWCAAGDRPEPVSNAVDALVCRLRRRLPAGTARCIEAVPGVGYRYRPPAS